MPEPLGQLFSMPEAKGKAPIIKLSCGIGDTDGFPAFDVDSDTYASKDDSQWGFLITGGAEFHMPLTVFQVTPDGLADKAGIRLGDIILEINEEDASQLTLAQAHGKINATPKKIFFLLKNMEEDDPMGMFQAGEEKSIVMRVPKPMAPLQEFTPTPLLGSRCWHPIMWQEPPEPPKPKKKKTKTEIDEEGNEVVVELSEDESSDEEEEELPHHRIIRNIRRFFAEVGDNQELRSSTIENMLLALPSASKETEMSGHLVDGAAIESRLLEMQRKLTEMAEIPKILSSTLATVSQTFDKLSTAEAEMQAAAYVQRKYSYDEDALDYELTRAGNEDDDEDQVDSDAQEEEEEDDMVQVADDDFDSQVDGVKQSMLLKDVTPESDYASEANYGTNEASNEPDTDDELEHEIGLNHAVYYLKLPTALANQQAAAALSSEDEEQDDDTDSDFLNTTYTWNLRNVPKLRVNDADEHDVCELILRPQEQQLPPSVDNAASDVVAAGDTSKLRAATPTPQVGGDSQPATLEKVLFKLDNLERAWPWADREKIIYRQSTCHLVRRQPLGLVGQRIQLLAKQQLYAKDKAQ